MNERIDPKERLEDFLKKVRHDIERILKNRNLFWVDDHIYDSIRSVWSLEIKYDFKRIIDELRETKEKELKKRGLTGKQLKLKIDLYENIDDKSIDSLEKSEKKPTKGKGKWYNSLFWVKKRLKAIDDILDSFAKVLGIVEPLKEFKQVIETSTGIVIED